MSDDTNNGFLHISVTFDFSQEASQDDESENEDSSFTDTSDTRDTRRDSGTRDSRDGSGTTGDLLENRGGANRSEEEVRLYSLLWTILLFFPTFDTHD